MKLRFTSCQAPNAEGHVKQIFEYLGDQLSIDFEYVDGMDWKSRESALFAGDIQVGWICGLPYVIEAGNPDPSVELLAAPVMAGERYQDQPVYFSDVIARAEDAVFDFEDIRSKVWAYNEPHSHSGYNITRFMLAQKSISRDFFGEIVEAGSHERALKLLLRGKIDATALDSTVLETELRNDPRLAERIRILESWGPSPIPPWVSHRSLDRKVVIALRDAMVSMNSSIKGKRILDTGSMSRFVQVVDSDYDRIRELYFKGQSISL